MPPPLSKTGFNPKLIRTLVIDHLREGKFRNIDIRGPVYKGMNSAIYLAAEPSTGKKLAVKICFDSGGYASPQAASREFRALRRVHEQLGSGAHFNVPAPVGLIEEWGLLITEWIDGPSLATLVGNWRVPAATLHAAVRRSGAWLRTFHDAGPGGTAVTDVQLVLTQLDRILADAGASFRANSAVIQAIACLKDTSDAVSGIPVPRSWLHGDFKIDNVLLAESRTVGVDIQLQHEGVVTHDIVQFQNHLEITCYRLRSLRHLKELPHLVRTFTVAYERGGEPLGQAALLWMRLNQTIRRWAYDGYMGRRTLRDQYLNRVLTRMTNHAIARLCV